MGKAVDTLTVGQERAYPVGGNYLTVVKSLQLLEIELIKHDGNIETHTLKGGTLTNKKFQSITVKNVGSASVDFTIVTGVGEFAASKDEAVVTVDTAGGSIPVTVDEGLISFNINQQFVSDTINNPGDVTAGSAAVLAIAANVSRKVVELCLPSTATNPVRVGNASVTSSSGTILEPGTSKAFPVDSALYVIRTSAPDEIVTVFELERV